MESTSSDTERLRKQLALETRDRNRALRVACNAVKTSGDWAEFGVAEGGTAEILLAHLPEHTRLWLFDSWEGLPEAWGAHPAGKHACIVPRFSDVRVRIVRGLYRDTVPSWVTVQAKPLAFIHVDCDLYQSAKDALEPLIHLLQSGTIIAFDEYEVNGAGERRAWEELGVPFYEIYVGGQQCVVQVK